MTSLKGNREAQRKRRIKDRGLGNPDRKGLKLPRLEPNVRVTKINIQDLDKYVDDDDDQ